jgi:2-polyprenyl-3-methyl-5-hydroxy-6-metoxy-1,4-benzoquinol methylase
MSSERQLDDTNNPWWGEHLHRYQEAAKLFPKNNLKILDLACGTGFGSNFIAQLGNKVIGGDLSESIINDCRLKYKTSNLSFECIDGTNISYENETFDVVISFETIEHTIHYQKMLNEFKRVVKKQGLIILSTPNFLINSPKGKIINPYHTQEWIFEDLKALLCNMFSSTSIFGQSYSRYKNADNLNRKLGKLTESLLYMRGARKLPIRIQDTIMQALINEPMYPLAKNYTLVSDVFEIKKCKTFFVVCKP